MSAFKLLLLPGDGIGPEIMDATLKVILAAGANIEIDEIEVGEKVYLEKRKVFCDSIEADFQIDDYVRWRLMEGLDDIGLTLRHESKITEFEKTRPAFKPVTQ